jgi:hypothetical protein
MKRTYAHRKFTILPRVLRGIKANLNIIGILTIAWGVYQFQYAHSIPVNISVGVSTAVDKQEKNEDTAVSLGLKSTIPITISVNAKNQNNWREIAIRDPIWLAYGIMLGPAIDKNGKFSSKVSEETLIKKINEQCIGCRYGSTGNFQYFGEKSLLEYSYAKTFLGAGHLIGNELIKPGEEIQSKQIIVVPRGKYDYIQLRAFIPTIYQSNKIDEIRAKFQLIEDKEGRQRYEPNIIFCRYVAPNCSPISRKEADEMGGEIHSTSNELWIGTKRNAIKL